jgi:hypothetical protein
MEALNVAIASDSIEITSFIPTKVILTLPQLYYLQKHNYINVTNRKCNKRKCEEYLQFCPSKRNKADGYTARCNKHKRYELSIKDNSFFAQHKISISKQIYIIDHLSQQCTTASICGLFRGKVYRETVTKILNELHQLMKPIVFNSKPQFDITDFIEIDEMYIDWNIPGNHDGSTIDEKLLGKSGQWLLGIINRDRTKLWVEPIKNRGKKEIFRVLNSIMPKGKANVFTDALTTYAELDHNHVHFVINKAKQGFGRKSYRLITGGKFIKSKRIFERLKKEKAEWIVKVHVNFIENNWMLLRKFLVVRQAYRHPHLLINYLAEFIFNFYKHNWLDLLKL